MYADVPKIVAGTIGKLPEATPITVSAGGSPVVTITFAPTSTASLDGWSIRGRDGWCAGWGALERPLLLNRGGVPFHFAAGPALDAANQFSEFVRAYAPLLTVPPELLDPLAMYIFALAIGAVVQNVPLGAQNRIKATLVSTGPVPTGTSIPGCPDKNSVSQPSHRVTNDGRQNLETFFSLSAYL